VSERERDLALISAIELPEDQSRECIIAPCVDFRENRRTTERRAQKLDNLARRIELV